MRFLGSILVLEPDRKMAKSDNKSTSLTPIIVALIGLCGTLVVGIFGFIQFWLPYQEHIQETQVALSFTLTASILSQPTVLLPSPPGILTNTPTSPLIPTDTSVPPPTPIDTPTSPPTPIPPQVVEIISSQDTSWPSRLAIVACFAGQPCPSPIPAGKKQDLPLSYCSETLCVGSGLVATYFNLANVPAQATIQDADLYLYAETINRSDINILISRADTAWSETEEGERPQCTSEGLVYRVVAGWNIWDITSIVSFQHKNPSINFGICLSVNEEVGMTFTSKEGLNSNHPRIRVVYLP